MPRLLNRWENEDSSDDDGYDDRMLILLTWCELNDSYDDEIYYESDKCDNLKNNEDWIYKVLDYAEYFGK